MTNFFILVVNRFMVDDGDDDDVIVHFTQIMKVH